MKHYFEPWSWDIKGLSGFAKLTIHEGDAHSNCRHCGVKVKCAKGETTTKFWVNGKWTSKRPKCEDRSALSGE